MVPPRTLSRRGLGLAAVLLAVGLLAMGGCGLRPIYANRADGTAGPAEIGLAEISVGAMPERSGQLLRQALQTRFERAGGGIARRYDLTISYVVSGEALSIQQLTSAPSRFRLVGVASWTLTAQEPQRRTLANGTARSADGLNLFDQQFFALDMESDAVQRRITEAVADQITLQLAAFFARRAADN